MSVLRSAASRSTGAGALARCRLSPASRVQHLSSCSPQLNPSQPSPLAQSLRLFSTQHPARSELGRTKPSAAERATAAASEEASAGGADAFDEAPVARSNPNYPAVIYVGPVSKAFRFLKGFSLTSLVFSTSLSPFIFILDAPLGLAGRCFLAGCAISTTVLSTAMIGWCSAPYVSTVEILEPPTDEYPTPAIRLLTYTTLLQPRYTTLTTPLFLHESTRPLSTWQLRPLASPPTIAYPDIVAQTEDKHGKILGRWDGEKEEGSVVKTFMVHEDLLEGVWGLENWRSRKTSDNP